MDDYPLTVTPKSFRIWDSKHNRWFQGNPSEQSRLLQTDSIHIFGEIILMSSILHDQNGPDVWRDDPEINGSLSIIPYLVVIQDIGLKDCLGNHIFEGDILEFESEDGPERLFVRYDNEFGSYLLSSRSRELEELWIDQDFSSGKIVGNIFENKELL